VELKDMLTDWGRTVLMVLLSEILLRLHPHITGRLISPICAKIDSSSTVIGATTAKHACGAQLVPVGLGVLSPPLLPLGDLRSMGY